MTSSFNESIELAPIVDTYVPQPRVQPKTGTTELAQILSTVNPNLIKFAEQRKEKADEIQEQRAMELIIQSDKKGLKKYTKEVAGQRDALAKAVKNKPRRTKKIMLKNPEDFNIRKPGGGVLGPRKNYKKGGTARR